MTSEIFLCFKVSFKNTPTYKNKTPRTVYYVYLPNPPNEPHLKPLLRLECTLLKSGLPNSKVMIVNFVMGDGSLIGLPSPTDFMIHSMINIVVASFQSYDSMVNYWQPVKTDCQ